MRGDMLLSRHSEIRAQPSSELHSHESLTLRSFASVEWFMLRGPSPCRVPRQMFRFYHSPAWAERQRKLMRKIGTQDYLQQCNLCRGEIWIASDFLTHVHSLENYPHVSFCQTHTLVCNLTWVISTHFIVLTMYIVHIIKLTWLFLRPSLRYKLIDILD